MPIWIRHFWVMTAYAIGGGMPILDVGRRCLADAEKFETELYRVQGYCALGTARLIEGQFTEARDTLVACTAVIRTLPTQYGYLPWVLALLAEAHLALGEHNEALAAAQEGIERGRNGVCIYFEACAQIALAQVLITTGGAEARAEIEVAIDRAEELVALVEGRSLSPRILELRGRLAAALGDAPGAGQALRQALDFYREIGATGHAERLAQEIAA